MTVRSRLTSVPTFGLAALVGLPLVVTGPADTAAGLDGPAKPNVITIVADDLGYADTSLYGGTISTPNITRLADQGVTFTQGYAAAPVCSPSRLSLLSGRSSAELDVPSNFESRHWPVDISGPGAGTGPTMAQVLDGQGYRTMAIGKWDISGVTSKDTTETIGAQPNLPHRSGFDDFWGILTGISAYCPSKDPDTFGYDPATQTYPEQSPEVYLTDEFTHRAVDFVSTQSGQGDPFFLYLSYNAPHGPLQTRTECDRPGDENDQRQRYEEMVRIMDEGIGQVLDALDAADGVMGNADDTNVQNTIVTFVSDNGPQHRWPTGDLRGRKSTLFEGGIRVPFAMRWPAALPSGVVSDRPVSTLDLLPTYAAAAGQPVTGYVGRDIRRTLTDGSELDALHAWRYNVDSTKRAGLPRGTGLVVMRRQDLKYLRTVDPAGNITEYLFDLSADYNGDGVADGHTEARNELTNPQYRGALERLRADFQNWARRLPHDDDFTWTKPNVDHPYGYALLSDGEWAADRDAETFRGSGTGYALATVTYYHDVVLEVDLVPSAEGTGGAVVSAVLGPDRTVTAGYVVALDRDADAIVISKITGGRRTEVARKSVPSADATDRLTVSVAADVVTASVAGHALSWRDPDPLDGGSVGLFSGSGNTAFTRLAARPS